MKYGECLGCLSKLAMKQKGTYDALFFVCLVLKIKINISIIYYILLRLLRKREISIYK